MLSLVLFVPIAALPAFWLAPPTVALAFYAVVLLGCVTFYFFASRLQRRCAATLIQLLAGSRGTVVQVSPYLRVHVDGEPWSARSDDTLRVGDPVVVVGVRGVRAYVRKSEATTRGRHEPPTSIERSAKHLRRSDDKSLVLRRNDVQSYLD